MHQCQRRNRATEEGLQSRKLTRSCSLRVAQHGHDRRKEAAALSTDELKVTNDKQFLHMMTVKLSVEAIEQGPHHAYVTMLTDRTEMVLR